MLVVFGRSRMQGFIVFDYGSVYPEFLEMILPYIRESKIEYAEGTAEGLLNGPETLIGIFTGRNLGRQIIDDSYE